MDYRFDEERIKRRNRRRLHWRRQRAEQRYKRHQRHGEFPLTLPQRDPRFFPLKLPHRRVRGRSAPDAPNRRRRHHHKRRNNSAQKHLPNRNSRHNGVNNQRQARRQQQSQRSRSRQQPERIFLRIPGTQHPWHQQSSQRKNRYPRGSSKRREERTHQHRHYRRAAAELPKQSVEHSHQPLRRAALRQEISRQSEQRQRRQNRIRHQRILRNRNRRNRLIHAPKQNQRSAAQRREGRHPQHRSDKQNAHRNRDKMM